MTPLGVIRKRAEQLAYLGAPDKLMAALANEFGPDVRLPSRKELQSIVEARRASFARFREASNRKVKA